MKYYWILLSLLISLEGNSQTPMDTVISTNLQFTGNITSAYSKKSNWNSNNYRFFSLSSEIYTQHDVYRSSGKYHQHRFLADVGFLKYIDSTWSKRSDFVQLALLWGNQSDSWSSSYSILLETAMFSDLQLLYDEDKDELVLKKIGGFGQPSHLELGYGAIWVPWKRSSVQFAFATIRLENSSKLDGDYSEAGIIYEMEDSFLSLEYGASMIVNINHKFNDRFHWYNNTRFFINGFNKDQLNLNFRNKITCKLWKNIHIKFDTRVRYNPRRSYRMGLSQELSLGYYYTVRK